VLKEINAMFLPQNIKAIEKAPVQGEQVEPRSPKL
jgi:hypothetical protein